MLVPLKLAFTSLVPQRYLSEFPQLLLIGAILAALTGARGRQQAQPGTSCRLHCCTQGALEGALMATIFLHRQDCFLLQDSNLTELNEYILFRETQRIKKSQKEAVSFFSLISLFNACATDVLNRKSGAGQNCFPTTGEACCLLGFSPSASPLASKES